MNIKQQQKGFSLVEMMISMVLGILLLLATSVVYLSSQRSSSNRTQYASMEDNARSALEIMTRAIEHTGYTSTNSVPLDDRFITKSVVAANCGGGKKNVLKTSLFGVVSNGVSGATDSIGVVYVGDSSFNRDCTGKQLPTACQVGGVGTVDASKIYNYFSVATNTAGVPVLNCAGSNNLTTVEVAEGVENLQVLYGVDNNQDNRVDQYVNADKVSSWNHVISVQLAVLIRSLRKVKNKAEVKKYKLLDNQIITTNDRYQRAVFTSTVRLRNVQL